MPDVTPRPNEPVGPLVQPIFTTTVSQPVFVPAPTPWEPYLAELVAADPPPSKMLPAAYSSWVGMIARQLCRGYPHEKNATYPCRACLSLAAEAGERLYPGGAGGSLP